MVCSLSPTSLGLPEAWTVPCRPQPGAGDLEGAPARARLCGQPVPAGPWSAVTLAGGSPLCRQRSPPGGSSGPGGTPCGAWQARPYRAPASSWPRPPPPPSSRGGEAGAGRPGPAQGHPAEVRVPVYRPGARGWAWGLSGKGWVQEPTAIPRPSSRRPWRPSCTLPPGVTEGWLALSPLHSALPPPATHLTALSSHHPPTPRPARSLLRICLESSQTLEPPWE